MKPIGLATADAHKAFLFRCSRTPRGDWRVEPCGELQNFWDQRLQRARPTLLGRGPTRHAAQHFADRKHEAEEMQRRFARAVASWLEKARAPGADTGPSNPPLDRLIVFAAHKFASSLRDELAAASLPFPLFDSELTHLHADELARHPAVLESLEAPFVDARKRKESVA